MTLLAQISSPSILYKLSHCAPLFSCQKESGQTVQTLIILLKKQSDQGLPCWYSDEFFFVNSSTFYESKEKSVQNFITFPVLSFKIVALIVMKYPVKQGMHDRWNFPFHFLYFFSEEFVFLYSKQCRP